MDGAEGLVLLLALYEVEHQIVLSQRATRAGDISIIAASAVVLVRDRELPG